MTDSKINQLPPADSLVGNMQFETDIGGTVANKVTLDEVKTYVNTNNFTPSDSTFTSTAIALALEDAGKFKRCSNAATQVITIPANIDVPFLANTEIAFLQEGAGQVQFVAGVGVTIISAGGLLNIATQYAAASLKKLDTNLWLLVGNLSL